MIKRLIFDIDNTILVNVSFRDAIKNALNDVGLYTEENIDNFIKGIGTYESMHTSYNREDYIKHMSEYMGKQLPDDFMEYFFSYLQYAIPEKNNKIIECIKELAKKYDLVILSNFFSRSQMNRLYNFGIGQYFSFCYGENPIKPNDEAYIKACGSYKPEECVMIGDDLYLDIECAQKNGLKTILVNTKKKDVGDIKTVIVDKVEDINIDIIESIK